MSDTQPLAGQPWDLLLTVEQNDGVGVEDLTGASDLYFWFQPPQGGNFRRFGVTVTDAPAGEATISFARGDIAPGGVWRGQFSGTAADGHPLDTEILEQTIRESRYL